MTDIDNPQYERATCYFCLSEETEVLEDHHIVPRRFGGGDEDENMVRLCPTCHRKIERLYDRRFYDELDVTPEDEDPEAGLDAEYIVTGTSQQRDRIKNVLDIVEAKEREYSRGVPKDTVFDMAVECGMDREKADEELAKLKRKGEIFEPSFGRLMTT